MSDINQKLSFLKEFPSISDKEWREKIEKDLKGADFNRKLVWRTNEGLNFQPYYRENDRDNFNFLNTLPNEFPFTRSTKENDFSWEIREDVEVADVESANKKMLDILEKGATSVGIVTNGVIDSKEKVAKLLSGILLDIAPVCFITTGDGLQVLKLFVEYCKSQQVKPKGSITIDPLLSLTKTGDYYTEKEEDLTKIKEAIDLTSDFPEFRVLGVNGAVFHNAGANMIQEMAYTLSCGSEYISSLIEIGVPVKAIVENLHFTLASGTNYFMEIAKFRALRLLWAKVATAYDGNVAEAAAMFIHAETSLWNKTQYDPHVNMLRVTTESMSAALGGVNSLTVHPYDKSFTNGSSFSERISRNTQIVLKDEAYFDKVVDPAAGSYYIETLTAQIAEAAWDLFTQTEKSGGYIENFLNGKIQDAIAEAASKRKDNIARRKEVLLGTNQYPNVNEKLKDGIVPESTPVKGKLAQGLVAFKASDDYEKLRLSTDGAAKQPVVFMLTIGNLTWRKARATFAYNFFGCAGYEIVDNNGFENVQQGVDAAMKANADVVVICSSDDEYEDLAPEAYNLLKDKAIFMVAGAPACADKLKEQGIQHFINVKTNALEKLLETNQLLGITNTGN